MIKTRGAGGETALALFRNRVPDKPKQPAALIVTKQLAGEYPEKDTDKEFHFTLTTSGTAQIRGAAPGYVDVGQ